MKRLIFVIAIVVGTLVGVGICALVVLSQWNCCALQPTVRIDAATDQIDGTTKILVSTTIENLEELQAFDANDVLIATIPTAFEKQVNTYFWQVDIPAKTQRIEFVMPQPIPPDIVESSDAPSWQALDAPNQIGFERVLTITLEPVNWTNAQDTAVLFSTTDEIFGVLHLYDANNQRRDSIDTAFVWDAELMRYTWQVELASDVDRILFQLRDTRDTPIRGQSTKLGWLAESLQVGFYRGQLPLVILTSMTERTDGQVDIYFEASEAVFDVLQLTFDGTVMTVPASFEPTENTQGFALQVTVPADIDSIVLVPVSSESRRVVVSSNVAYWDELGIGDGIGFFKSPYP
ncbi:MAG: hypothetical protein ACO3F2_12435 [Roseiflexaceae bacterium]